MCICISSNMYKGLIGISPDGLLVFVSELYTGSISDKKLMLKSGLLNMDFTGGDMIMEDIGFKIVDLLHEKKSVLNIPPFLTEEQFSADVLENTQEIAQPQIHVESMLPHSHCI